jgi:hypothetical protein
MITIHADRLQPGDVVVYGGHDRRITRVDRRDGWAWPIAADGTGWAIALDHRLIHVHRNAARFHLSVAIDTLDAHANQVTERTPGTLRRHTLSFVADPDDHTKENNL